MSQNLTKAEAEKNKCAFFQGSFIERKGKKRWHLFFIVLNG